MQYLLGFDCGATNIIYKLTDISGKTLLQSKLNKPSNILVNNVEDVSEHIRHIINNIITSGKIGNNNSKFDAIVVGAAGAGREKDADALQNSLISKLAGSINYKNLIVVSDAAIALEAAFPNQPGCILIAGTGSIIYGKNKSGTVFRAGGYGRIIGDAGSGYSIGRKVLKAAAKDFDKKINSPIAKLLGEKLSISNFDELITEV